MVGVEVGDHQQVDALHAQPAQATGDGRVVLPGVDEHRGLRSGADDEGVALPHVARHGPPPGRRPGASETEGLPRSGQQHHRQQQHGGAAGGQPDRGERATGEPVRGGPARGEPTRGEPTRGEPTTGQHPPEHEDGRERRGGEEQRTADALGPGDGRGRHLRPAAGHERDPGGRPARAPRHPPRDDAGDRGDGGGHHAEHGRGCDGRRDEHVRGDRDEGQPRVDEHDDRRADRLGRRGDGQGQGEGPRQPPAERVRPRPGEHHQPGGRQHGQGEAERPGQPRVDDGERDDGDTQRRDAAAPAGSGKTDEADDAHHPGPQHAGLGSGEDDEPGEPGSRERHPGPQAGTEPRREQEHGPADDRDVAACDRTPVGCAGAVPAAVPSRAPVRPRLP
ncbi:hypothetical protein GCM10027194_07020 [Thalassiella azotivora]